MPDIHRHIWLYDPQTQDSTFVGYVTVVFRPIHILFSLSRGAARQIGPFFQDARQTATFLPYLWKSQKASERTQRLVIRHIPHNPARTSRREIQAATTRPEPRGSITFLGGVAIGAGAGARVTVSCNGRGEDRKITELVISLAGDVAGNAPLADLIRAAQPVPPGCPSGIVERVPF